MSFARIVAGCASYGSEVAVDAFSYRLDLCLLPIYGFAKFTDTIPVDYQSAITTVTCHLAASAVPLSNGVFRLSGHSDTLHPPPSPYPQFVDPSPVDSNGTESTETTDIDDDVEDLAQERKPRSPKLEAASPHSPESLVCAEETIYGAETWLKWFLAWQD